MARRLRFNGTGSGGNSCPSVHEFTDTGEIVVHGPRLTDPEAIAQLQHLDEDEIPIVVPRNTLVDFGPKDRDETPRILPPEEFFQMIGNIRHSAWHLEMRRRYAVDEATDTYAQFVRGEAPTWDMDSDWARTVTAKVADGCSIGRVRIVDNPPTQGQRYLLAHAEHNAELGEDVRNMWRDDAYAAGLPDEDFWIYDSHIVAVCQWDDGDNLTGVELVTEPARVNQYNRLRDAALHYATPWQQFNSLVYGQG